MLRNCDSIRYAIHCYKCISNLIADSKYAVCKAILKGISDVDFTMSSCYMFQVDTTRFKKKKMYTNSKGCVISLNP